MGNGPRATGGTAYYERRLAEETAVVGAQARATFSDTERTYLLGGVGKYYLDSARVLLMGELNLGMQEFADTGPTRPQLATYLGASYTPLTGIVVGAAVERYDQDFSVADLARDAASLTIQYFPLAHWELMLIGKMEFQGGEYAEPASLGMFQLHYYL